MTKSLWLLLATAGFVLVAVVLGWAAQEETGVCLPERHAADQNDAKFCHCLDMGGYRFCKEDEHGVKHWNYRDWSDAETPTPMCEMSCKEEHCTCCTWQDNYDKTHKRASNITIPYDNY